MVKHKSFSIKDWPKTATLTCAKVKKDKAALTQ